jgi:hypothetical protein
MYPRIDELMSAVECTRWPSRWREIYDSVMIDYENNGTPLVDPDFYRELHSRYGGFPRYLDVICDAAVEIGKNENLSRLLVLLGASLADREHAWGDVAEFTPPTPKNGERDFPTDMLTGLATVSMLGYAHEKLLARNIPTDIILGTTTMLEAGIREFAKRHGGAYGYHLMNWNQRAIDGTLFRIGRLEIELSTYGFHSVIFENESGNTVVLANGGTFHRDGAVLGSAGYEDSDGAFTPSFSENGASFVGCPYGEDGRCLNVPVTLDKSIWKKRLSYGDKVIALHIPAVGPLTPDEVDASVSMAKEFVATYFPEWSYNAFICESWILDPQLEKMLGEGANIVKFGKRFSLMSIESGGRSPYYFVFLRPNDENPAPETFGEATRLERALKTHYMQGGFIYDTFGYFLD